MLRSRFLQIFSSNSSFLGSFSHFIYKSRQFLFGIYVFLTYAGRVEQPFVAVVFECLGRIGRAISVEPEEVDGFLLCKKIRDWATV